MKALRALAFSLTAAAWLFLVGACVSTANAATVTLSCTAPTKNTDGSDITGPITYTAHYGTSPATLSGSANLGSTCGGSITVPDPAVGQSVTYHFGVKATVGGNASALSNIATKTLTTPNPTPNPPTGLAVDEDTTAYVIKQTRDNIAIVAVGEVPPGTQCEADKGVIANGSAYHVVPRDRVSWAGTVRSEIVVARCS